MSANEDVTCVVLGDELVGKSYFLARVLTNEYPDYCEPTIYENYFHTVQLRDGRQVTISFSDICTSVFFTNLVCNSQLFFNVAGSDTFRAIRPQEYRKANVFLVCFAIDCYYTFEHIKDCWIPEVSLLSRLSLATLLVC